MIDKVIPLVYLAAAASFILALKWLSAVHTARRGVIVGVVGMALAVGGTLLRPEIVSYRWIAVAFVLGTVIGVPMAMMPMTAVPQRTALSHAFGALAAALVGTSEFYLRTPKLDAFTMSALTLEVLLGFLTFTASLMAFGKLQEILPTRPITYRGQNVVNLALLSLAVAAGVALVASPARTWLFPAFGAFALVFGVLLIIPIGGADMPTVISLLNSYAGTLRLRDGVRARQPPADRRRRPRRLVRADPLDHHVPRDEPVVRQRAVRGVRPGPGLGGGGRGEDRPQRHGGGSRADPRERRTRDRGPRLRHGGRAGAAQGARAVRRPDQARRRREVRDPPGGRAHAGAHERAARGGRHPLRPPGRDGRGELRLRAGRRRPGDRGQRRHQPRGAPRQVEPDLRHADPRRGQGAHRDGHQASA